jgi:hypothetical protein
MPAPPTRTGERIPIAFAEVTMTVVRARPTIPTRVAETAKAAGTARKGTVVAVGKAGKAGKMAHLRRLRTSTAALLPRLRTVPPRPIIAMVLAPASAPWTATADVPTMNMAKGTAKAMEDAVAPAGTTMALLRLRRPRIPTAVSWHPRLLPRRLPESLPISSQHGPILQSASLGEWG